MELRLVWSGFAKAELRKIYGYYKENASLRVAQVQVSRIVNETKRLIEHPELGVVEELLRNRGKDIRSLIFQKYKIIYHLNQEKKQIEVIDIFNTYMHPDKIRRS